MPRGATLGLVFAVALALRLPGFWTDFWLDEIWAVSNVAVLASPFGVFTGIHHDSNHWLISLWFYTVGQDSPFWVYRLPSLAAGLASVWFAGLLAREEGASPTLAMFLVAIAFPLAFYATEARGYAVAACAGLASLYCLLRWLDGASPRWLVAHWAAATVGLLAHLSFIAVIGAEAVFLILLSKLRTVPSRGRMLPLALPVMALTLLIVFDLRFLELGGGPDLNYPQLVTDVAALAIGAPVGLASTPWLAVAGGAAMIAALVAAGRSAAFAPDGRRPRRLLWLFYALVLFAPLVLVPATNPPFLFPRYFLVGLAFVPLLAAAVLTQLTPRLRRTIVAGLVMLNGWSYAEFWAVGRGHYPEALLDVMAASGGAPATVRGDHDFRTRKIVSFYRDRLGAPLAGLRYSETDPGFFIVSHPDATGPPDWCGDCELFGRYPSSPLSGARWLVYRRASEPGASGVK